MYLIGQVGSAAQKERFLAPMIAGEARSAFFMTEPAAAGGAGSDPSMMQTIARQEDEGWVIDGRKAFVTGADGARVGIVMARTDAGAGKMTATMFLVDLPNPAIRIDRVLDTIDSAMPGGHAIVTIDGLRVSPDAILGAPHERDRHRLCLPPPRVRQAADRPRRRGLRAGRQPNRPASGRVAVSAKLSLGVIAG